MEIIGTDVLLGSLHPEPQRLRSLDLPPHILKRLETSFRLYQQHARLIIRMEEHAYPMIRFGAVQWSSGYTGKVLTQEEIAERTVKVVRPLRELGWEPMVCVGEISCFTMDVVTRLMFEEWRWRGNR